jgi:ribonuclease P protein component
MRLRRPQDFRRVWKEGRSWAHPLFILWAAPNELPYSRLGFTASRKVGNAVTRNRARRLLREAARHLYPHLAGGRDVVLVARRALPSAKTPEVESALEATLRRAQLWRQAPSEVRHEPRGALAD